MLRNAFVLGLLLLSLCACGDREAAPLESAETPAAGETPIGPISSRGQTVGEGSSLSAAAEGEIDFAIPAGWQSQPPTSSMRVAQAAIPGPAGPGELFVFHFGVGGGGGVEANIERWIGQMEGPAEPERGSFEANGYQVTWVEVQGTLMPSGMGTGPTAPQPNSRLLAAVVEGPGGPWFFKATGPEATVVAEREAFMGMLRSVKVKE